MIKKITEEKASIAVYVTVVLVGFMMILAGIYFSSISARKSQLITVTKIKESYEADNKNAAAIYRKQYNRYIKNSGT